MTSNKNIKKSTTGAKRGPGRPPKSASSNSGSRQSAKRTQNSSARSSRRPAKQVKEEEYEFDYIKALVLIGLFAAFIFVFLFSLGVFEGKAGIFLTGVFRGLFGYNAFVLPIIGLCIIVYYIFGDLTKKKIFNIIFAFVFDLGISMIMHSISFSKEITGSFAENIGIIYHSGKGGGAVTGLISYVIDLSLGRLFNVLIGIVLIIASIAVIFGKYIVVYIKYLFEKFTMLDEGNDSEDDSQKPEVTHTENKQKLSFTIKEPVKDTTDEKPVETNAIIDVKPEEIRSFFDTPEQEPEVIKESNDIHRVEIKEKQTDITDDYIAPINILDETIKPVKVIPSSTASVKEDIEPVIETENNLIVRNDGQVLLKPNAQAMLASESDFDEISPKSEQKPNNSSKIEKKKSEEYYPPKLDLLVKGENSSKSGDNIVKIAEKLKETLSTFGVEVEVDPQNCSRGPAVTRYELIPAPGVKVSRIVSLSDDIKLSLGAADIRIEAPIPGKSAVGIEVPNSESSSVAIRELLESHDFQDSKSNIVFAVGKDLAGKNVIGDIAKMPHMLIAGATGSGKSVCINSIIISILYKAHPDDVKLILIDPKVVELSVYNGIPHLLLPVVTDPKKASGSLHWAVGEMEKRYKLFADAEVRDLKGYNEKADNDTTGEMTKMPQIVIIVDELADMMMVAGKEVEESICRLAQLARAAGIHLILATQRPSVDVITGLIKANMPSRIAFSVSSGIDSRTILDANGAEKLLGKGDMLFFPQGYNKPARVQGCFVSDKEVTKVVDFVKGHNNANYDTSINESISSGGNPLCDVPGGDIDDLFSQAGTFIIGKEKASIGALQRAFKIGFNRAARIMDQLEAKGVVGPEEGTKPRKILMDQSQFDDLINSLK